MGKRTAIIGVSLVAAAACVLAILLLSKDHPSKRPPTRDGFYVSDGRLYDANNTDFVIRGVGHVHSLYAAHTADTFAQIKALGANTVRVELSTGALRKRNGTAEIAGVISLCRANRLICVLAVFDTIGWGDREGAVPQAQAVDYWISVQSALAGQEKYAIINVANEPYGLENHHTWLADTVASIHRLRNAGFRHTLMVDAPDWGQDWSFTMRDNAATVFRSDPQRNTVFSVHMYGAFDRAVKVTDYLDHYVNAKIPIVVGEFGFKHSDGEVDEDTIMSHARAHGIGYLGWSWSGNGGDVHYLDLVSDFDAGALTRWGERLFFGPNGIRQTSREASVYAT